MSVPARRVQLNLPAKSFFPPGIVDPTNDQLNHEAISNARRPLDELVRLVFPDGGAAAETLRRRGREGRLPPVVPR
jgi:hypothetical protein